MPYSTSALVVFSATPPLTRACARVNRTEPFVRSRSLQRGGSGNVRGRRTGYPSLLRSAGFVEIEEHDRTADYLSTPPRQLGGAGDVRGDMYQMSGREPYDEMQAERRLAVAAIESGLLRRALFVARRPQR